MSFLTRWDPVDELNLLRNRMDRLWSRMSAEDQPVLAADWSPTSDIIETKDEITIKAELPGVDRDDVSVTVENGDLVIQGERHSDEEVEEEAYYRMERFSGTFYRRFAMPEGVDEERISAEFKDGVLEVTVPKPTGDEEQPERKTIQIR